MFSHQGKCDPRIKIKWANKHIEHLNDLVSSFLETNPYEIVEQVDPQAEQLGPRKRLNIREPILDDILCLTGDILHSLRTSLDYLVYRIMPPPPIGQWSRKHGFPIAKSADEYKATSRRKIDGLPNALMERIDALQPYKGGNDALWRLHELDIIDKHRLLITVRFAQQFTTTYRMPLAAILPFVIPGYPQTYTMIHTFPMDDGAVLFRSDSKMHVNDQSSITIALNEPGIVESEPLIPALVQFADLAESVIAVFDDIP